MISVSGGKIYTENRQVKKTSLLFHITSLTAFKKMYTLPLKQSREKKSLVKNLKNYHRSGNLETYFQVASSDFTHLKVYFNVIHILKYF